MYHYPVWRYLITFYLYKVTSNLSLNNCPSLFRLLQQNTEGPKTTEIDFSQCWRLGSPRSRCLNTRGPARAYFLIHMWPSFLPSPHTTKGSRARSQVSFLQALIPFTRALPSGSNHLPRAPPSNTLTPGMRFQHKTFVGDTNVHFDDRLQNLTF